jgi:predicted RecA/RadA family phage recombinase
MATGTVRSSVQNTRTLKYVNSNAVAAGDIVLVSGSVWVALGAYGAGAEGVYAFRGRVELPKEASLVVAGGDVIYWVAASSNCNKTASGNTKVGIAVEASAAADTTVLVELKEV